MAEPQPLFDYTGYLPECPTWSEAEKARETLEKTLESAQKENDTLSRRAQANELLVSAQAALEQGDYAALRSHLTALEAYADALKDDGAALYEILRSYID